MRCGRTSAGLGLLLVVSLLVGPIVARAQGIGQHPKEEAPDSGRQGRTFGQPSVSHTLQAFAFTGFTAADSANFTVSGTGARLCSSGSCAFATALQLPAGALLTTLELAACDTNPAGGVRAQLFRVAGPDGPTTFLGSAGTGVAQVPGCGFFSFTLAPAHEIDNLNSTYFVLVDMSSAAGDTRFQAVRIFYNLQMSPAPATATFNDVPTGHVFFRFIEALVAAGITGGCSGSPPLYCPDATVTRGQMAVFLSRALGLQFGP